jgi:3-isopropylmalate/(R)-2-methylmalate dehydratase small subunit
MMSLEIVKELKGRGIAVRGNDIDTDRIIPARFLKCVTFDGIGEHAFADDIKALAEKNIVHPFVNPTFKGAKVLVSNKNFGCGSSREHAPQSLKRWGIDVIIAESYSEIFYGNCVSLAVPCFTASNEVCNELATFIENNPNAEIVVSVENRSVTFDGKTLPLEIKEGARGQFLDGSWNARAGLLLNLANVKVTAQNLPYVGNYQG